MDLKTHIFKGKFTPLLNGLDFSLEFNLTQSSLKIKGFSKKFLIEKIEELEQEHGIYILEGEKSCYVGQSKNIQVRINHHKEKNKAEFNRCFILSRKETDLRAYLDYMESYTIKKMDLLGYHLDNTKKPDPDKDILDKEEKALVNDWVNEFLSFLPILGFKKIGSPEESIQFINENSSSKKQVVKYNKLVSQ